MSTLSLDSLKSYLRVIHSDDDSLLQDLLDAAESEALAYLRADSFEAVIDNFPTYFNTSSSETVLPPEIQGAIKLLVRADYEAVEASHAAAWRDLARDKMWPYRLEIGV